MPSIVTHHRKQYDLSNAKQRETYWTAVATDLLRDRTIKHVRYMTKKEATDMRWDNRPLVIILDNDVHLYASRDTEGNGPGELFTSDVAHACLPSL